MASITYSRAVCAFKHHFNSGGLTVVTVSMLTFANTLLADSKKISKKSLQHLDSCSDS